MKLESDSFLFMDKPQYEANEYNASNYCFQQFVLLFFFFSFAPTMKMNENDEIRNLPIRVGFGLYRYKKNGFESVDTMDKPISKPSELHSTNSKFIEHY